MMIMIIKAITKYRCMHTLYACLIVATIIMGNGNERATTTTLIVTNTKIHESSYVYCRDGLANAC